VFIIQEGTAPTDHAAGEFYANFTETDDADRSPSYLANAGAS
jgi:hypothetical protein